MPSNIVKLGGKYLIWSTVVDAPISYGMTLEELHTWVKDEYGEVGLRNLPERLKRVEKKGTSSLRDCSAEDTVEYNRAGPNESRLTVAEIIAKYCEREGKGPP